MAPLQLPSGINRLHQHAHKPDGEHGGTNGTDADQAPTFVTPPPRASSHLSPIPEVSTPQATPPTPNPPPFPPNLGRLTPAQLPIPPSTDDARQKVVVTETEPLVSTTKASSSRLTVVQRTNPTTHPHHYLPQNQHRSSTQNPTRPLNPTTTHITQTNNHNKSQHPNYHQPPHQVQNFPQNRFSVQQGMNGS
jgi:hypothetical protein